MFQTLRSAAVAPKGFYERQLLWLCVICAFAFLVDRYVAKRGRGAKKDKRRDREGADEQLEAGRGSTGAPATKEGSLASLARKYLIVYAIVMGADWLQGPYVYSLYREQYEFPERLVAVLFVTGFISAGLAAPLVGVWADQHGRCKLCLVFCVTYTLTCVCILVPSLPVLLMGRFMGGVSTSILFSAFESWLISSASSASSSSDTSAELSSIMGRATLINGLVATAAGVFSNHLVASTGSFKAPFVASAGLLVLAWVVIRASWGENYGSGGGNGNGGAGSGVRDVLQIGRLGEAWRIVRKDPHLLVLGTTQTCFEGSMYLFVFLWVPSLQEVTEQAQSSKLPFGYIFSAFMISMMLGSLLYTAIVGYFSAPSNGSTSSSSSTLSNPKKTQLQQPEDTALTLHAKLSSLVCAMSALAFAASIKSSDERVRFWAFCVFEGCVGIYYPVQGTLRGMLISNEHRATLSALFRVPLNVFVVVSLLTGVSSARRAVLTASAIMLAFSSLLTGAVLVDRGRARKGHGGGEVDA